MLVHYVFHGPEGKWFKFVGLVNNVNFFKISFSFFLFGVLLET